MGNRQGKAGGTPAYASKVIKFPFDISHYVETVTFFFSLARQTKSVAVRSAEATVAQANSRLLQARYDIQQAEEKARNLTSEQEIVRRSQQYAAEIVTKAQAQAKELSRNATVY